MSLGNNIHIKRKETGITQEDLANRLGVSRQAVSDWERDVKKPETQNLINLAKLLDASLDWLCADGKALKIAPALLEFARRADEITADIYISKDKEDLQ